MKKLLLSLSTLMLSAAVFAQTNSDASGNMTNGDDGYTYQFTTPYPLDQTSPSNAAVNCIGTHVPTFATPGYTISVGTDYLNAIKISAATGRGFFTHWKFTDGNCTNAPIDLSGLSTVQIKIRAKASVDGTVLFGEFNGTVGGQLERNRQEPTVTLTTDWAEYTYTITSFGTLDPAAIEGVSFHVGGDAATTSADVWIDWVEVGSAVTDETGVNDATVITSVLSALPSNVKFYPNPSSSNITVENVAVSSLKVMDMNGSVVRSSSVSNVSVEGLTSGLYFLQINGFKPVKVMVK